MKEIMSAIFFLLFNLSWPQTENCVCCGQKDNKKKEGIDEPASRSDQSKD
jgi:hypothetical protein